LKKPVSFAARQNSMGKTISSASIVLGILVSIAMVALGFTPDTNPIKTNRLTTNTSDGNASTELALAQFSSFLPTEALKLAWEGFQAFQSEVRADRLVIIDFSLPSTQERFFVLNPQTGEVLYKKLVAHGQGSGDLYARTFSNQNGSHQSSLGFLKTAETYTGKHGYSLRLDGLQPGLNSAARERAVVIHQADYVSAQFAAQNGYLGRSWGCPALPADDYENIISDIQGGTLILIYHPQLSSVSKHL